MASGNSAAEHAHANIYAKCHAYGYRMSNWLYMQADAAYTNTCAMSTRIYL